MSRLIANFLAQCTLFIVFFGVTVFAQCSGGNGQFAYDGHNCWNSDFCPHYQLRCQHDWCANGCVDSCTFCTTYSMCGDYTCCSNSSMCA